MDRCPTRVFLACAAAALLLVLGLGAVPVGCVAAAGTPIARATAGAEAQLRASVEAALPAATGRGVPRFTRVALDPTGDLTVIFKVESATTIPGLRAAAIADELALLRAIYHSPAAGHVRTTTVVGTYSISQGESTRELPIVRATLTAKRAARIDWATLRPDQLPNVVDDWWLHPALNETVATPAAFPTASPAA